MNRLLLIICCFLLFLQGKTWGQRNCGYDIIHKAALSKNPNFDADRSAYLESTYKNSSTAKKTTGTTTLWVPVVFHIVLDNASLTKNGCFNHTRQDKFSNGSLESGLQPRQSR